MVYSACKTPQRRYRFLPTKNKMPKVYTYCSEYHNIEQLVLAKPSIETGGDLFGLWLDDSTVILQVIGGPGRNCKRTIHSFFQDVEYLEKTGHHLTQGQGLCNVGEWHSHHRLGLPKPSAGDRGTVWNNLPKLGLPRFVLLIANIRGNVTSPTVNIGAFLFDGGMEEMKEAEFIQLDGSSPFRSSSTVMKVLEIGKEPVEDHGARRGSGMTNKDQTGTANLKDSDGKASENPWKKKKRNKNKKNKNKNIENDQNQNEQTSDLSPGENSKSEKEIVCEDTKNFESITNLAKTAPPEVKREDVASNTQPPQFLNRKQRKKVIRGQQRAQNQPISSKNASIISIHASQILEFASKLCKDLDEPRLVFNKESLFNLNFQITPEDGSGISVSISKSSTAGSNVLSEITLNTNEGMVKEEVVSWPLQEEESQKLTRSLKKKLKTLDKTKQSSSTSRWQRLMMSTWRMIQTRMRPSNCVIL